jgi:acetate kinase
LDSGRNANADSEPDVDVSTAGSPVRVLVVRAREDLEIARQTRAVLD